MNIKIRFGVFHSEPPDLILTFTVDSYHVFNVHCNVHCVFARLFTFTLTFAVFLARFSELHEAPPLPSGPNQPACPRKHALPPLPARMPAQKRVGNLPDLILAIGTRGAGFPVGPDSLRGRIP